MMHVSRVFKGVSGLSLDFHRLNLVLKLPRWFTFLEVFNSMVAKISMSSKARVSVCHGEVFYHVGMCKGN